MQRRSLQSPHQGASSRLARPALAGAPDLLRFLQKLPGCVQALPTAQPCTVRSAAAELAEGFWTPDPAFLSAMRVKCAHGPHACALVVAVSLRQRGICEGPGACIFTLLPGWSGLPVSLLQSVLLSLLIHVSHPACHPMYHSTCHQSVWCLRTPSFLLKFDTSAETSLSGQSLTKAWKGKVNHTPSTVRQGCLSALA